MSNQTPLSTNRVAPIDLWRCAGEFLETLIALFGAPGEIAGELVHTVKQRRLLLTWLRAAEAMMRRMLLIEASRYLHVNAPPSKAAAPQARALRRAHIAFKCLVSRRPQPAPTATARVRKPTRRFSPSRGLAARFAALLRAYENPAPLARRLARRLRAAPLRAIAMLAEPWGARYKIGEAQFSDMAVCCGPMLCTDSN